MTHSSYSLFRLPVPNQPQTLDSEIRSLKDRVAENKINLLNDRIAELEKNNTKLKQTLGFIKSALRKARLTVDLDGNLVSIADPPIHATQRITGTEDTK